MDVQSWWDKLGCATSVHMQIFILRVVQYTEMCLLIRYIETLCVHLYFEKYEVKVLLDESLQAHNTVLILRVKLCVVVEECLFYQRCKSVSSPAV